MVISGILTDTIIAKEHTFGAIICVMGGKIKSM